MHMSPHSLFLAHELIKGDIGSKSNSWQTQEPTLLALSQTKTKWIQFLPLIFLSAQQIWRLSLKLNSQFKDPASPTFLSKDLEGFVYKH